MGGREYHSRRFRRSKGLWHKRSRIGWAAEGCEGFGCFESSFGSPATFGWQDSTPARHLLCPTGCMLGTGAGFHRGLLGNLLLVSNLDRYKALLVRYWGGCRVSDGFLVKLAAVLAWVIGSPFSLKLVQWVSWAAGAPWALQGNEI